ncbi:hypothetical protein [Pseudomonas amygdali]
MGFDATDENPWVDSLIAFQKNEPIGTMRIIRANRDTIDRLLSYELWKDHIDQCIEPPRVSRRPFCLSHATWADSVSC